MIPPQEASARRREIEDKLKQEEETLSFIRDSLEKSDQLTKNMVSILSSFESRLMKLENSIIPVHKQTENLQRLQENVEKTLSCLDHVISYYHVASDTEKIIREGPTGRLEEYLGSMAKIQKAVEYFQDNSPDSPELNKVKLLFERGKEALESEFRSLMTRHSKVVSPVLILDLISGDDDLEAQEDVTLEHLPESVLQDVIRISRWLVEYGRNQDFMNVYYQIRSSQLDRSIKGLKEHFHKSSSSSGVPYSPAIPNKRKDTPTKKPVKRPGTIRKAQNLLKQYSQHGLDGKKGGSNLIPLEGLLPCTPRGGLPGPWINAACVCAADISPGHEHDFRVKHLSEALNDKHGPLAGRDDMLDVETDAYIHCVSAFVKLAQSEYQLLADIIPEHHQKKTFDSLIQDALDGLMLEGENIVSAARKAIVRHDFSTVLTVFPILRHLKQTKPEFDQVLQGTAASTKNKLPGLITSMETIGAKALEDFADNIKNDPDKEYNMPKDGTVHELTSNAILFLQQLLDFQETAGAMLASQETSSSATSYSSEFSKRLLSTYICKVLGNLQLNLLSKSKVYEDPALSAIFLHNNYNYILKSLEKSELIQLVAVTQKTAERSYREHIEQQIQTYQRSWLKVTDYIAEKNLPVFQPGVKLRDKERQIIKERFKGFNDGLEELCKIQKAWAIPDTEQRDRIRQAQKTIVKETYGAFLQKFGSVPFTKNPEKYIKYGVEQVGDMIDRLFDTSA
ncbi:exocyst complex component 7 [Homo sapiens]|uniref:Exocyst complex component 7 n=5 Tax=Hominidae TaxID=9604 RepID=EXOC7_HUMAN|nr:exocyst complex component 7 isoform 4 [Homo sapiens]Q9UPT5.3 RecName: Full=Exocyst complex component 7; AltName: Full=Exocyst complex component Exo70 [Homo sapiens]EAW89371.1 exocyst complex component 7, isoform CRA_e [Homo sapiens]KAI2585171.1 exocyst complex component 7 [Homo sapiens]KAI4051685.1 exocyst complex component 7 [Homo sapiens]|eukprot:NP_001138769.1 exocyst complex component 7 isoform 4 [Homo sapiens]